MLFKLVIDFISLNELKVNIEELASEVHEVNLNKAHYEVIYPKSIQLGVGNAHAQVHSPVKVVSQEGDFSVPWNEELALIFLIFRIWIKGRRELHRIIF
jgi:hypothetical protein